MPAKALTIKPIFRRLDLFFNHYLYTYNAFNILVNILGASYHSTFIRNNQPLVIYTVNKSIMKDVLCKITPINTVTYSTPITVHTACIIDENGNEQPITHEIDTEILRQTDFTF